ncbi:transposase, partial [Yersinia enterocolitica]
LLSWVVPSKKQQNTQIQKDFLNALARAVNSQARVIIVTDAGFQNAWFRHIKSLGWDFIGRIRGNTQMRLGSKGEYWFKRQELQASSKP